MAGTGIPAEWPLTPPLFSNVDRTAANVCLAPFLGSYLSVAGRAFLRKTYDFKHIILCIVRISEPIRETRRLLGISQTALAVRAGVSLATVQNIEAGRANPSLSTLERLLAPLGLGLAVEPRQADWDALAAFGLPLTGAARAVYGPTKSHSWVTSTGRLSISRVGPP